MGKQYFKLAINILSIVWMLLRWFSVAWIENYILPTLERISFWSHFPMVALEGFLIGMLAVSSIWWLKSGLHRKEYPVLKKSLDVFFNADNPYCYGFDTHENGITHEQFFRLGLTNSNMLPAKEVEVILIRLTRENLDGQAIEIPLAPARLRPFGLSSEEGLFEIGTDTRYVNIAYMHGDFDTEVTIPPVKYVQGSNYTVLLPLPQERYRLDLLVRGANTKETKYAVYLEHPDKYWSLSVKVDRQ